MANLNHVILIGNLTRDPEIRYTGSGRAVVNLGLAVNRFFKNSEGERVQKVDYFNVVVWDKQAENCSEYLRKGRPVAVEGRLQSRSWETPEGKKRNIVEVVARNVQFLGRGDDVRSGAPGAPGAEKSPEINLDEEIPF